MFIVRKNKVIFAGERDDLFTELCFAAYDFFSKQDIDTEEGTLALANAILELERAMESYEQAN